MDLSTWLLRRTPPRPLVVTAPGGTEARLAVERHVRERGWRPAMSPAEANILVAAGAFPELEPHLARLRNSIPAPRARVDVTRPHEAPDRLDAALRMLRDAGRQREEAAQPAEHAEHEPPPDVPAQHGDHHDHGHHGHHMGGMGLPGGVPMADRADDRDGLKLDQLQLPLGPALPLWPAGLIVHTRLQGDVIQEATVEVLDSGGDSFWWQADGVAHRLDSCARLLALTGWADASVVAQRLRDDALAGASVVGPLRKWATRVRRSRTLRWLLAGIGSIPEGPASLAGDALARLYRWLEPGADPVRDATQWTVDNLPALLDGVELATARLIVASLDPDLDLLAEARHG